MHSGERSCRRTQLRDFLLCGHWVGRPCSWSAPPRTLMAMAVHGQLDALSANNRGTGEGLFGKPDGLGGVNVTFSYTFGCTYAFMIQVTPSPDHTYGGSLGHVGGAGGL
eukprot:COSAG01_NODE_8483_length_2770_cov_2.789966_4_plen_109_part_00